MSGILNSIESKYQVQYISRRFVAEMFKEVRTKIYGKEEFDDLISDDWIVLKMI